jgi:hypothetical protein
MSYKKSMPNCKNCEYDKECDDFSPHGSPYTCGMFGEWVTCSRCNGDGFTIFRGSVVECMCSNGYVKADNVRKK